LPTHNTGVNVSNWHIPTAHREVNHGILASPYRSRADKMSILGVIPAIDPEPTFAIYTPQVDNLYVNPMNWRKNMSIEQLANLSEVISGIVVAVTLIIVVFQMRQNNEQVQAEAIREGINDFVRVMARLTSNEVDAANFRIGLNNFSNLSSDGKACFHSKMVNMLGGYDQVYNLYLAKRLKKSYIDAACRTFLPFLKTKGGK
jgi:hypothetical protein